MYIQLTSFNNQTLEQRFGYNIELRKPYIPIHHAPAHPDTDELLHLERERLLNKPSYIKLQSGHDFEWQVLKHYN